MFEIQTLIRASETPLLTRKNLPNISPEIIDGTSVFNPGAISIEGKTHLLTRVQTRGRQTFCVAASETAGGDFKFASEFTQFNGHQEAAKGLEIFHIYDARLTFLNDTLFVITAMDTSHGCRCAIWKTSGTHTTAHAGLENLHFVSLIEHQDTRNAVLFPEKIDGLYQLLHRPNNSLLQDGPTTGTGIHLSTSEDLNSWQDAGQVMTGRPHYWDELIGSGPPPIKTRHGWLHIYHGVATHFQSANIYQAGAVLLDLNNPSKVLARTRDNILEPRTAWELTGQVPNVVFPSGITVSEFNDDGFASDEAIVSVYYGAADTCIGLARNTVSHLVATCSR
ncbi:MAG: hypothetical protein GY780_02160 [bacterium]|nr:hypothetical protein [bacterium]